MARRNMRRAGKPAAKNPEKKPPESFILKHGYGSVAKELMDSSRRVGDCLLQTLTRQSQVRCYNGPYVWREAFTKIAWHLAHDERPSAPIYRACGKRDCISPKCMTLERPVNQRKGKRPRATTAHRALKQKPDEEMFQRIIDGMPKRKALRRVDIVKRVRGSNQRIYEALHQMEDLGMIEPVGKLLRLPQDTEDRVDGHEQDELPLIELAPVATPEPLAELAELPLQLAAVAPEPDSELHEKPDSSPISVTNPHIEQRIAFLEFLGSNAGKLENGAAERQEAVMEGMQVAADYLLALNGVPDELIKQLDMMMRFAKAFTDNGIDVRTLPDLEDKLQRL